MKKKSTIIITEQQFNDVLLKGILSDPNKFIKGFMDSVFNSSDKKDKSDDESDIKTYDEYSTHGNFRDLNLNNIEDFNEYVAIANKFISSRSSNLLGITGTMLANAAKNSLNNLNDVGI
jgi:hypothetical protein